MKLALLGACAALALAGAASAQSTSTPMSTPAPSSAPAVSTPAPARSTANAATATAAKMGHSASAKTSYAALYRRVETKLKQDNLYSGPIDGRRTAAYVAALEKFQTAHNIKATGRLTPETRKALGI